MLAACFAGSWSVGGRVGDEFAQDRQAGKDGVGGRSSQARPNLLSGGGTPADRKGGTGKG